jgi:prepilin-type N-terminal cleavage/methylation domain-containing protein
MRKIKAFTLMELLVGMVIGSIVIALGYSTYAIIYKQYSSYKKTKQQVVETIQLNTIMSTDFINSDVITYSNDKLILNKNNSALEYQFNDSFITRTQHELTDTFKVGAINILTKLVDAKESNFQSLITNFTFDVVVLESTEHFTFAKTYSAETLMTYEIQSP